MSNFAPEFFVTDQTTPNGSPRFDDAKGKSVLPEYIQQRVYESKDFLYPIYRCVLAASEGIVHL